MFLLTVSGRTLYSLNGEGASDDGGTGWDRGSSSGTAWKTIKKNNDNQINSHMNVFSSTAVPN